MIAGWPQRSSCSSPAMPAGTRREIGTLADVEPARARLIAVLIVDQPGEILAAGARDPVVLERLPVLPARRDIEIAEAVGPEQPLVARAGQKVGPDRGQLERQGAERLASRRSPSALPTSRQRAATLTRSTRPPSVQWQCGRAVIATRSSSRARIAALQSPSGGRASGHDLAALLPRQLAPAVDVGRELLGQHQDALALAKRQVRRGDRHAVARRRHQGDVVGRRAQKLGEQRARPLAVGEEIVRADRPRPRLAGEPLGAQRRPRASGAATCRRSSDRRRRRAGRTGRAGRGSCGVHRECRKVGSGATSGSRRGTRISDCSMTAHSCSMPPRTQNASALVTVSVRPGFTTLPRTIKRSPSAAAKKFTLYSVVSTSLSGGIRL